MPSNECSESDLRQFIADAKRAGFAGDGERRRDAESGGKLYLFSRGDFSYRDRYFGSLRDIGQEIVWFGSMPIWGMNYMGGMRPGFEALAAETFGFLKRALVKVTPDSPFRGPPVYEDAGWAYQMDLSGELWRFEGLERITQGTEFVYDRNFFGGSILHKKHLG